MPLATFDITHETTTHTHGQGVDDGQNCASIIQLCRRKATQTMREMSLNDTPWTNDVVTVTDDGASNSDCESDNPRFWLEFRTFNDGMTPSQPQPSSPDTPSFSREGFPQFARLPPELRLKIWSYLIQPRVVVACCMQRADPNDLENDTQYRHHQQDHNSQNDSSGTTSFRRQELDRRTTHGHAVPVVLHVNRESRAVGLEHYELTFSWRITKLLSDTPASGPARVYFNFAQDCLLLTGELEAYDSYGFNSPMVYFLRREDTHRVRHVACAFRELGYPEQESDMIFGCLWHVVDRFPAAERLLLTVGEGDEERLGPGSGGGMLTTDNVVQKIWSGWMSGTTVTGSRMAGKQMLLVREEELMQIVARQS